MKKIWTLEVPETTQMKNLFSFTTTQFSTLRVGPGSEGGGVKKQTSGGQGLFKSLRAFRRALRMRL